jgi:glycosyltransferase involved in cell wall biosynthesis
MQTAVAEPVAVPGTPAGALAHAELLLRRGEAAQAAHILLRIEPGAIGRAEVALRAGRACLWLHRLPLAAAFLQRAAALSPEAKGVRAARAQCRALRARPAILEAAHRDLRAQLERIARHARTAQAPHPRHVHVVCKLDTLGGTERRALNIYRSLAAHVPTTLWSTVPAGAAALAEAPVRLIEGISAPRGGILVTSGSYYRCGDWLENAPFERVVICHNLAEQYADLAQRLSRLEANPSHPQVALTFPSRMFKAFTGLPGTVEYSPVDTTAFRPRVPPSAERKPLRIGRHGRAWPFKFHPNDPSLFRALLACGHSVRILGGSVIAHAFNDDQAPRPELLDAGALPAPEFLADLDVFLYRKHPQWMETGGTVILEAMASALPVVAFAEGCGYAELIEDGRNGFLVASEAEACARIDELHADPALRARLGEAARATMLELMQRQQRALLDFYLGDTAART